MPPTTIVTVGSQGATRRHTAESLLTGHQQDLARADANHWIKRLRLVRYGALTMRERFTYRDDSLWWFTELYLHKMRRLERAIATILAMKSACASHAPQRLIVECHEPAVALAATAFGRARRMPVDVVPASRARPRVDAGLLVGVSALLSRLRRPGQIRVPRARMAAFVHTAFWRRGSTADDPGRESYIGAVLDALADSVEHDDLRLIGVGPRRTFRARRWWDPITSGGGREVTTIEQLAPRSALGGSLSLWRRRHALAAAVVEGPDIRAAGSYRDYDLWPVLSAELRDAARIQWPWSARAMDEARSALTSVRPDVALTYAEAGGWGRALVLEARRLSIPTVGLQHGFIYRHWLNYQHEPDELAAAGSDAGFPHPTHTLVFDRYAAASLETAGHLPSASIRVTGSPKLDELVQRHAHLQADRAAVRRELGVPDGHHLLVLAAKGREIEPHLPALFAALRGMPEVRLVIKPHPSEPADIYLRHRLDTDRVGIGDPHGDLGRLLAVADGLVTMNSTVAIDALVLHVPAVVVGLPNNLSPFVDADVMIGADGDAIGPAIRRVLYDQPARDALVARGAAFAEAHDMRGDGGAARRAAEDILALGQTRRGVCS